MSADLAPGAGRRGRRAVLEARKGHEEPVTVQHPPEDTFESLQKNVYDGVINVTWRDFATGFDRLNAVQDPARDMPSAVSAPPTESASKNSNNDWPRHTARSCACNA
jgi:hypothetical protein